MSARARVISQTHLYYMRAICKNVHTHLYTLRTFPLHDALITVKAIARVRYIRYPAVSCLT